MPFDANISYAKITNSIFENNNAISSFFKSGDFFLVDRGFRDSIQTLKKLAIDVRMSEFIEKGNKQLLCEQANNSRLVTKCRFVIEVINGRLKSCFRYFDKVWSNKSLPHMIDDFRIAASIHNAFYKLIYSDIDDASKIAEMMSNSENKENKLFAVVTANNLNRQSSIFHHLNEIQFEEFPRLSLDELRLIALGSYQLKQAKSYIAEHNNKSSRFEIFVNKDDSSIPFESIDIIVSDPCLVRVKIQSRHRNQVKYFINILIDKSLNGKQAIKEYCCQCKNGLRTIGCCAHVMSILWYLGFSRFKSNFDFSASFLDDVTGNLESDDEIE